ncbi:MAG: hypothetical protein H6Q72_356 [Firmicutes bacterium]|nr:hypothetical protein [Bacillota bacterium]
MNSVQKVAVFFIIIGLEKGKKVMDMMDNAEIKNVLAELGKLAELSPQVQETVLHEFEQLGYHHDMNPAEILYVVRQLFNGGKISNTPRVTFPKR